MAIIDQRILIPARQDVVWAYISDLFNNCQWQVDCHAVSFLTTKHSGPGTRWRSTTDKGRDVVLEITSWYNGLGYEYSFVDGGPFRDSKGRVRLQEIPEGTVVQWTFTFEGGGLMGGRAARGVDGAMAASLKTLYKQVKALSRDQHDELLAKSLMREAPDVEARAAYKPRHPSSLGEGTPAMVDEDAVLLPVQPEPPLKADDAALVEAIDLNYEPPVNSGDTRPREPVQATPESDSRFAPPAELTLPAEQPEPEPTPEPPVSVPSPLEAPRLSPEIDRTVAAVAAASAAAALPPPDTEGVSIWERFGVPRPVELATPVPVPVETPAESPKSDPRLAAVIPAVPSEPAAAPVSPPPLASPAAEVEATPSTSVERPEPVIQAAPDILPGPLGTEPAPAPVSEYNAEVSPEQPDALVIMSPKPEHPADPISEPATAAPAIQSPRIGLRLERRRALLALRRPQ